MSAYKERSVILIGDTASCLIAASAGIDYYVFNNNCNELYSFLTGSIEKYGVFIVLTTVLEKCREVDKLLRNIDALVVAVDHPSVMKEVEPKSHYEKLAVKYLGQKVQL